MSNDEKRLEPLCRAVRALRESIGDTQQRFANRLNIAISTAVRYELTRPPSGEALAHLMNLALESGQTELAELFRKALADQMGCEIAIPGAAPGSAEQCGLPPTPGESEEVEYLKLILRGAQVGLPGFETQRTAWRQMRQQIAADGVRRATIRALIAGLYQEVSRRLSQGESDESVIAAATADPEIVRKMIARLREASSPGADQDLISELMAQAA